MMFSVTRQHRFRSSLLHAPLPFIFPWHQNFELRLRPLYGCFLRRSFCCNVFGFRLTSDYISCCLTISLQRAKSTTVSRMWQKKKKKISAHEVFFLITVTGQTRKARYQKKESAFFFFFISKLSNLHHIAVWNMTYLSQDVLSQRESLCWVE